MIFHLFVHVFRTNGFFLLLFLSVPAFAKPVTPDFFTDCVGTGQLRSVNY